MNTRQRVHHWASWRRHVDGGPTKLVPAASHVSKYSFTDKLKHCFKLTNYKLMPCHRNILWNDATCDRQWVVDNREKYLFDQMYVWYSSRWLKKPLFTLKTSLAITNMSLTCVTHQTSSNSRWQQCGDLSTIVSHCTATIGPKVIFSTNAIFPTMTLLAAQPEHWAAS